MKQLTIPQPYIDTAHYLKELSKQNKIPLDMVWALYQSDITEEEFYSLMDTCKSKKLYK